MMQDKRYISSLGALALSFGYAVGWGAFVMPGTTFLPSAGPLGTVIGVLFGALAMGIFAINYHRLTTRYPGPGGAATFAQKVFGEDHGFLVAWFLWLTYIAILWANATAMILIVRFTLGDVLQFGFHYTVAGFDVYFGEAVLSIISILICGGICLLSRKLAVITQIIFASVLAIGVFFFFFFALAQHKGGLSAMAPAFMDDVHPVLQISRILALMPWAFVGFEAISHTSAEFRFPLKRTAAVLFAAIILSTFVYLFLALLPIVTMDADHRSWIEHLKDFSNDAGIKGVPVFASADPQFALVLTDMWMPVLDGEGLVRAIRADEHLATIPVHVVTADTEMEGKYDKIGFDGFILKPVTVDKLRAIIG